MHRTGNSETENHEKVFEKLFKNPLTKSRECDIILKPICEAKAERTVDRNHEKVFKKLLKTLLTKSRRCDIMSKHFRQTERGGKRSKIAKKVFKKLFKNPLTNRNGCDIINGSRKTRRRERKNPHRSLTIEQQEIKVQAKA